MIRDVGDARLFEECDAFYDAFARYARDCAALDDAEAAGVEAHGIEGDRRRASMRWREALRRISGIPARTVPGLLAKGGVLKGVLAQRPPDEDGGTDLFMSFLADLKKLLN